MGMSRAPGRLTAALATLLVASPLLLSALPLRLGDLDEDNQATILDVVRIVNHLTGFDPLPARLLSFADVNEDTILIELARNLADEMLRDFPDAARAHLQRWMANKPDYLHA